MEKALSVAKINNNLRPMYVKEILLNHTDEEHFITVGEILDILSTNYGIDSKRKTIYDDIEMLIQTGSDIECVNGKNNRHLYHMLSRDFDFAELRILIDAVESLRSIPLAKSDTLKKKISKLAGPSEDYLIQNTSKNDLPRTENPQIYYIIDTVYKAIVSKKQIAFKYCEHLTYSKKPLKREGVEYLVSPYRLVCYINYYYLIGFSEKHMKTMAFRVDCMCDIPAIMKKSIIPEPKGLLADKAIKESLYMKVGKLTEITIEFSNSVTDDVAKHFGDDLRITAICDTKSIAKVMTEANSSFFAWIFSFEGNVRIIGPADVLDQYTRMVAKEMARL